MAKASHKLAGSYISVRSKLDRTELLKLAETVGTGLVSTGIDKRSRHRVRLTSKGDSWVRFALGNDKLAVLTFRVDATTNGDITRLRSKIDGFRTSQDTMFGFIPAGPKELRGWRWYVNFMKQLQAAVLEADRNARIEIVEQAG